MSGIPLVVLVIAPEKFRDEELFIPMKALKEAGYQTLIAGTKKGKAVGMLNGTAEVEIVIEELQVDKFSGLIIVGGTGASDHLWNNSALHEIVKQTTKALKPVGSICISPVVLAKAGILRGKKATVWKSDQTIEELNKGGADYVDQACVQDGLIVTANGPKAAMEFVTTFMKLLPKSPK